MIEKQRFHFYLMGSLIYLHDNNVLQNRDKNVNIFYFYVKKNSV